MGELVYPTLRNEFDSEMTLSACQWVRRERLQVRVLFQKALVVHIIKEGKPIGNRHCFESRWIGDEPVGDRDLCLPPVVFHMFVLLY